MLCPLLTSVADDVVSSSMTSRFAALCALVVLALGACAPLAVGGEWSTATPVQRNGWTITTSSLRFDASGSVVIAVTARPGQTSCAAAPGTVSAQWFINSIGRTVVKNAVCTSQPVDCEGRPRDTCDAAASLATVYVERGDALVSEDGQVVLTRAAR